MARKREKKKPEKVDTEGWVMTFGDLISLMLTFFVLIVSMSTMDDLTLKEISDQAAVGASVFDQGSSTDLDIVPAVDIDKKVSMQEMMLAARQKANRMLSNSVWKSKVSARIVKDKFMFSLPSSVLFSEGGASLKEEDIVMLRRLARLLASTPGHIRVEGHTSSDAIPSGSIYPDAWSLSLARAASVLHVLEAEGVSHTRLSLVGYGPSKPVSVLNSVFSRAKNRRVDIVLYEPPAKKHQKNRKSDW
ncbi:chemotaxis protein MotB [Mariprofundus ferrinatatus]|uniref:Chemotaxis protein MotB n=1 Tax=Mariprofundus ferrinatatus TaxID=1921087 RepID=A0A2K8L711_9PROT|nr:flagellar motor protein MotB [Mariprofundus ferrinatatus]ATX82902.1 chemotaxis protein MotB [Mariprofundus ferrinatatus]